MDKALNRKLVVCIVKKGKASKIIKAAKKVGLEGSTELLGEGTPPQEGLEAKLGLSTVPQKDVILAAVTESALSEVIETMVEVGRLNEKNTGVLFVVKLDQCGGIAHMLGLGGSI